MLSPEVWSFEPPSSSFSSIYAEDEETLEKLAQSQHFNHHVSVTIPDLLNVPQFIVDSISVDSDFYHASGVFAFELVDIKFINAFVRKGHLTLLSVNTKIDEDNCVVLTPTGKLIFSLTKETFQKLGLEGKATEFVKKDPDRFLVTIDLKADYFQPGKKNFERVKERLQSCRELCFNIIFNWEPHADMVCPSSIAAYISEKYVVKTCLLDFRKRISYSLLVPDFNEDCDPLLLTEWLGAASLQCNINSSGDGFISTFASPESTLYGQVCHLEWTGLMTSSKVVQLIKNLLKFVSDNSTSSWVGIHVQGFEDTVINRREKEHQFYSSGDYSYTIFLKNSVKPLVCSFLSSTKRPARTYKRKVRR